MIGYSIDNAKKSFFDRPAVMNAVDRAERGVLSKFGAFVRQRARSLIRRRKRISDPGSPPSSHTDLLKKFIFFAFDASTRSVVIGPVRLNRGNGTAPRLLEEGGTSTIFGRDKKSHPATYKARPYMGPSLKAELPRYPGLWANSVKA